MTLWRGLELTCKNIYYLETIFTSGIKLSLHLSLQLSLHFSLHFSLQLSLQLSLQFNLFWSFNFDIKISLKLVIYEKMMRFKKFLINLVAERQGCGIIMGVIKWACDLTKHLKNGHSNIKGCMIQVRLGAKMLFSITHEPQSGSDWVDLQGWI